MTGAAGAVAAPGGAVSLDAVGRALRAHLADAGTVLLLRDRATGEALDVPPELAGDPAGLLPVFLVAGEAVWREATGKGFALRVRRDPAALLGYRAEGIGAGTFCAVMLSAMEAVAQARENGADQAGDPGRLVVNDLIGSVWQAVLDRAEQGGPAGSAAAPPASVAPSRSPSAGARP